MAKAFCTNCQINWASLWSNNGRHTVEFCPCCNTDIFLEEAKEGAAYIRSFVDGTIIDSVTKKKLPPKEVAEIISAPRETFDIEKWREIKEAQQEKELFAIAKYQEVYESQGPEVAEQLYFKILKK